MFGRKIPRQDCGLWVMRVGCRKKFHPTLYPQKSKERGSKIQGRWMKAIARIPSTGAGFRAIGGQKSKKSTVFGGNERVEVLDFCRREKNHTASMVGKHAPDYLFFWIFGFLNTKTSKTRASTGKTPDHFHPNFHPKIQGIFGFLPRAAPASWFPTRAFAKGTVVSQGNHSKCKEPRFPSAARDSGRFFVQT